MKILKNMGLICIIVLLFNGCLDFTRYKSGKVLKTGEVKITGGEVIVGGDGESGSAFILPKIGASFGLGKGVELGVGTNTISVGAEIRKQFLTEEKNGVNATVEAGVNGGAVVSFNGGMTFSKTLKNGKEPYFGLHYNKYKQENEYDEFGEGFIYEEVNFGQLSSLQLTTGLKMSFQSGFELYPEINIYRYTEEHSELSSDAIILFGLGMGYNLNSDWF